MSQTRVRIKGITLKLHSHFFDLLLSKVCKSRLKFEVVDTNEKSLFHLSEFRMAGGFVIRPRIIGFKSIVTVTFFSLTCAMSIRFQSLIFITFYLFVNNVDAYDLDGAKETYLKRSTQEKAKYDKALEKLRSSLIKTYDYVISDETRKGNLEKAIEYKEEKDNLVFSWENNPNDEDVLGGNDPEVVGSLDVTKMTPISKTAGFSTVMINKEHKGSIPVIDGEACKKFIWAHAPSVVKYEIPKNVNKFKAKGGSFIYNNLTFVVKVDGKTINEYNLKSSKTGHVNIDVDIPKRSEFIELVVDPNGDSNGDSSYWAYPEFQRVK